MARRSAEERVAEHDADLRLLANLCESYDLGQTGFAFLIALQVQKVLTEGAVAVRRRADHMFPSPDLPDDPANLMGHTPLVMMRLRHGDSEKSSFEPISSTPGYAPWKYLKFNTWWNEVVFRASAAPLGTPHGQIPIGPEAVPYERRERLSRRLIIQSLRNHKGAHSLEEFPAILDAIDGPESWGGFSFRNSDTGEVFATWDGTLDWGAGQLAAMSREIAYEVLVAFGLSNPPLQGKDRGPFLREAGLA